MNSMRKIFLPLVAALLLASCSLLIPVSEPEPFITVKGSTLMRGNHPYYFAGTNFWYGAYLGSPGNTGNRERLVRELDSLNNLGLKNLRILGASEESALRRSVRPAIQSLPGTVDDSLLQGLDFVLSVMAERGMHAVIYLNNYWEWSGGMAQYNVWANGGGGVNPENPAEGWGAYMDYSASFYANEAANEIFRRYVRGLLVRKNSCNGRAYNQDPTIMAWQLANEPRPGAGKTFGEPNLPAFFHWIDATAGYIHSLDTNHLVSTGSEGTMGCLQSAEYFLTAHGTHTVDYLTFHLWPFNWGWYDPRRPAETLPDAEARAASYIASHIALARQLNKPLVLEEFGLGRDSMRWDPGTPVSARDHFYERVLAIVYDSARTGAPIAGSNFWAWGGDERGRNPDGMWREGDPFLGDPPQEAQGLNSVFVADTSTTAILRSYAQRMSRLGNVDTLMVSQHR